MSGIAGIANPEQKELVDQMMKKMNHRGQAWSEVISNNKAVLGINGYCNQKKAQANFKKNGLAKDGCVPGRFAQAQITENGFVLKRDPLGAAPLYYGWTLKKELCFASEVKALILATQDIHELPPGTVLEGGEEKSYFTLEAQQINTSDPAEMASSLRHKLEESVERSIGDGNVGSWLSGGLDSSIMAALVKKRVPKLHTFAAGLPGAPDLKFARQMASYIKSEHHEVIVSLDEILSVLPDVIYSLESFDALLVRSSILNFLVARQTARFTPAVFSGEGGDELFAGYEYLKSISPQNLSAELVDILKRLHNTALQRVDRCASANGTLPHVGFLDPELVKYALGIPAEYKLHDGVEKWILRESVSDLLPEAILHRTKAKFWEGGGVENILAQYAEKHISDADFAKERHITGHWKLNTKEEVYYFRLFKQFFGESKDLGWMGRTKGSPVS